MSGQRGWPFSSLMSSRRRAAVEGGGDLARVKGAVVGRVVPGEAAFVAGFLPEGRHPLDRLDGVLRVQHHLLARLVGLRATEGPRQRIRPAGRVVDGVTERLAEGLALLLEGGAELSVLVQGPGRGARSRLGKPGLAVVDERGSDA